MCFKETLSTTWWNAPTLILLNQTWTLKATHHQVTIKISSYVIGTGFLTNELLSFF